MNGEQAIVPLEEIQLGDSVLVLPGERFPVDATILEGRTTVDESMLTGESTPLDREPGGRVLAGALITMARWFAARNRWAKPRCWRKLRAW